MTLSMKSVRSAKSVKSAIDYSIDDKPLDLEEYIMIACKKYPCPCKIIVKKDFLTDDYAKMTKQESSIRYKRISLAPAHTKMVATPESATEETASKTTTSTDEEGIVITALYDSVNRLADIVLNKLRSVPRLLMQILGLILPNYQHLTKITIKRCRISAYTLYEMSKFVPFTTITEVCLDGSPVPEANYVLLLESQSKLTSLSLCRCNINDEVCQQIATKLCFLEPAEAKLSSLNLSSNRITDEGAKHLGEALRTNRHLRYLNLADNRIGDEGAHHIFHALIDFPLTYDETMAKRHRYMNYLRARHAVYLKYMTQCDSRSNDDISMMSKKSKKSPSLKTKVKRDKMKIGANVEDFVHVRAEMLVNELIGPFIDPFERSFMKLENGLSHCIGNMMLCYLNLCYNEISFVSLKKLQAVLFYQSVNKKPNQTGLMRVLVEGNRLPASCCELERVSEMLHRNVVNFSAKYIMDKRKTRTRISIIPERNIK